MTRSTRQTTAGRAAVQRASWSRPWLRNSRVLLAFLTLGSSISVWADEPRTRGIEPYYGFVHWVSMGELDRAARQFAPDARVIAGPACTAVAPCVGREAIERHYLSRLRDGALPLPITDQRFDGQALSTRGDTLEVRDAGESAQRLRLHHRIEMGPSGITSLRLAWDASDPVTAQWLARRWRSGLAALP